MGGFKCNRVRIFWYSECKNIRNSCRYLQYRFDASNDFRFERLNDDNSSFCDLKNGSIILKNGWLDDEGKWNRLSTDLNDFDN